MLSPIKPRNKVKIKKQKVLDAYFATEETKKEYETKTIKHTVGVTSKASSLSSIANAYKGVSWEDIKKENKMKTTVIHPKQVLNITTKVAKKGEKVTFTRLKNTTLGNEVYIIVETLKFQDKSILINIKQGKVKGIVEKDKAIQITQNDKETVLIETTVGEFAKDDKVSNKDDFKDWAIAKVKLSPKTAKTLKAYTDTLKKLTNKKTLLYLLIDAHSKSGIRPIYNGLNPDKDGEPDDRTTPNYWLDMKDKWFEVKYAGGILKEMKVLVDKHIKYSQVGVRDSLSVKGLEALDCSETVAIYLHKLGVMPKLKVLYTGVMTTEKDFKKAIGSDNIKFVKGSDKKDFKPERGDVFVWRDGDGHTGIVYDYDALNDVVTILEAIGSNAVGETKQVKNGGYAGVKCSRTAKYGRLDGALYGHRGWKGYFRPINYTKTL